MKITLWGNDEKMFKVLPMVNLVSTKLKLIYVHRKKMITMEMDWLGMGVENWVNFTSCIEFAYFTENWIVFKAVVWKYLCYSQGNVLRLQFLLHYTWKTVDF